VAALAYASSSTVTGPSFNELNLHVRAEDAGVHGHAGGAHGLHVELVELLSLLGCGGVGEARPVAFARIRYTA